MKNNEILNSEDTKDFKVKVLKQKCDYLYKHGKSFTLIKSGSSYELVSNLWNEKAANKVFNTQDLQFIKSVRAYVDKNNVAVDFVDTYYKGEDIQYIKVKDYAVGERIEDLVYIDINGAYWQTAHHLGIINDALYTKGLEVSKIVRLAALGSLAKTKDVWKYDGKDLKKAETIRSSETENLWFAICKRVSDVMVEVVNKIGDDFVFYWVDGIYIRDNVKSFNLVNNIFLNRGYTSKFEKVPYIEFNDKGFKVQGVVSTDLKHFSWANEAQSKSGAKSKPITDYLENKRLLRVMENVLYSKNPRKLKALRKTDKKNQAKNNRIDNQ
jgi:hypothetical protein